MNSDGLCACGCGGTTNVASRNIKRLGIRKGEHFRFILGHNGHPNKLEFTEEQVRKMESMYGRGHSTKEIADEFGCLPGSIWSRLRDRVEMRPTHARKGGLVEHSHGYLKYDGEYVHRIVAEAWYGMSVEGQHVHHRDGDKTNCHPKNLEILPPSEHHRRHYADRAIDEMGRFLPLTAEAEHYERAWQQRRGQP